MPFANFALAAAAPGSTSSWFPGGCSPGTPSEASSCPRLSQRRRTSRLCRSQLPPRLRAPPGLDRGEPVLKRTAGLLTGLRRDYHERLPVRSISSRTRRLHGIARGMETVRRAAAVRCRRSRQHRACRPAHALRRVSRSPAASYRGRSQTLDSVRRTLPRSPQCVSGFIHANSPQPIAQCPCCPFSGAPPAAAHNESVTVIHSQRRDDGHVPTEYSWHPRPFTGETSGLSLHWTA